MNMLKIIKGYFIFMMLLVSMSYLSQNDAFEDYYASVLGSLERFDGDTPSLTTDQDISKSLLSVQVDNSEFDAYVWPGATDKEILKLDLEAKNGDVDLDHLKFKLRGVRYDLVKFSLYEGGEMLMAASSDNGILTFEGLNLNFKNGDKKTLTVTIDLSEKVMSGTRIRLDVEDPSELSFDLDRPIKGPYLTVIGR